ncbi:hypothetical protein J5N97_012625 [Dioscorea zingiberensis]|uniref:Uncharacterized protein n=1 Tax=Dioscorea zingiberensis TaxID=325984 RepID=A0A9D5CP95_9LILI|nr:hypothetical protein J5N97_012625 [Dioscorea zingiberensis]
MRNLKQKQPVEDLYTVQQQRKKQTVEDLLREQIQKQEFYKGGDGGSKKPPKHGGGGGGGGSDNSNFSELRDELLQVILATIGFVFLYVCIVRGDELTRLSVDFIRYLFGAQTSPRLKRAFDKWEHLSQSILGKHAKITREEKPEITTTEEMPEDDDDDEHWME